jgi:ABC-type multidrug transport system ATPase subunit
LAGLASDRIVLLSTHIVEDVAVLCPRFAVISRGQLVAETTPEEARRGLAGKIFEGSGSHEALAVARDRYLVTQSILVAGETRMRVCVLEGAPPVGFKPVEASLEDTYMTLMAEMAAPGEEPPPGQQSAAPAATTLGSAL